MEYVVIVKRFVPTTATYKITASCDAEAEEKAMAYARKEPWLDEGQLKVVSCIKMEDDNE